MLAVNVNQGVRLREYNFMLNHVSAVRFFCRELDHFSFALKLAYRI